MITRTKMDHMDVKALNMKQAEQIKNLQNELDRLKALNNKQSQEILNLKSELYNRQCNISFLNSQIPQDKRD